MTRAPTAARVAELLRREFDLRDVTLGDTTRLREELLLDSLALVELAMVVEDTFEVGVSDADLAAVDTVGDLSRLVAGRLSFDR